MPVVRLPDRGIVSVSGHDARALLDRLLTCDLDAVSPTAARFGALLTPQGKILADFLIFVAREAGQDAYLLDVAVSSAEDLVKRLNLYRLRAQVVVANRSGELTVVAGWGQAPIPTDALAAASDPRQAALGWRAIVTASGSPVSADDDALYHARRTALGIPEAGRDFPLGDAFPHEALMDQLGGVDFGKGCYVGQEVVSRMQHRGTARTRILTLRYEGADTASPGADVTAGERMLGKTGSASSGRGFAMIRVDRAADALEARETVLAGGRPVRFEKPDWARFPYPDDIVAPAA